jgi:hypothetical protein
MQHLSPEIIPEKKIPEQSFYLLILVILPWGLAIAPAMFPAISSAMAQEPPVRSVEEAPPLPQSTGSSQDLRQLEQRRPQDWQWQNVLFESKKNFNQPYPLRYNISPNSANPNQGFEDWEQLNQGDSKEGTPGIQLTTF